MRQVAIIDDQRHARRFTAYLITRGIDAHAEQEGSQWAVWVRDENQTDEAKEEYRQFIELPEDARYAGVERQAEEMRRQQHKQVATVQKKVVDMRSHWNRPATQRRPFTIALVGISVVVAILSGFGKSNSTVTRSLLFADAARLRTESIAREAELRRLPSGEVENLNVWQETLRLLTADIRRGQIWRVLTPIFVHYGVIHLVFNMLMMYQLGGMVEERRGSARLAFLVVTIGVISVTFQALVPIGWGGAVLAGGMSGVVFGVFGYIWMQMLFNPESGLFISRDTVFILMLWLFLGIAGVLRSFGVNIANWAHGVGLVVGLILGAGPSLLRR